MTHTFPSSDKINGSFLLGACGDALGAPIEMKKQKTIYALHGRFGLKTLIEHRDAYGDIGVHYPPGQLTDDTTMTMTTAAAIILSQRNPADGKSLNDYLWQGYLNWGMPQEADPAIQQRISKNIDPDIVWPGIAQEFWSGTGAGRGTIACLMQSEPGSTQKPLMYNETIRGKTVTGPNKGCGGMMRSAPLGLLPGYTSQQVFQLGCSSAALTHGDPGAFVASGVTALFVHLAAHDAPMPDILTETQAVLDLYRDNAAYASGIHETRRVLDTASQPPASGRAEQVIEDLPQKLGYKNAFLAMPVLAQVTYALHHAELRDKRTAHNVRKDMILAVNHSGDSDSVGAIVGNVIGARYGKRVLPMDWVNQLPQRDSLTHMAYLFHESVGLTAKPPHTFSPQP